LPKQLDRHSFGLEFSRDDLHRFPFDEIGLAWRLQDLCQRRLDALVKRSASRGRLRFFRVDRLISSTPTALSSARSDLFTDCSDRRRWREAAAWLPFSTTARNAAYTLQSLLNYRT
jgi:hypothetical protein